MTVLWYLSFQLRKETEQCKIGSRANYNACVYGSPNGTNSQLTISMVPMLLSMVPQALVILLVSMVKSKISLGAPLMHAVPMVQLILPFVLMV